MLHYYLAFLPLLLFGIFASLLIAKKWMDSRYWPKGESDKLLRPAGESLRRKIEETDAKLHRCLAHIGIAVIVQLWVYLLLHTTIVGWILTYLLGTFSLATVAFALWNLVKAAILMEQRRRHSLGYQGERLVGEHLNLLTMEDYRIFHDLQFEGFNIDHAVVGPGGVFTIETKTCPRRKVQEANRALNFDGERLHWPNGKINELGIKQASERSETLQQWLGSELGKPIEVHPMLVFPGWTVESGLDGPLKVLSPKRIRTFLKSAEQYGESLPESQIKRIAAHLAEKSRLAY